MSWSRRASMASWDSKSSRRFLARSSDFDVDFLQFAFEAGFQILAPAVEFGYLLIEVATVAAAYVVQTICGQSGLLPIQVGRWGGEIPC
jgi:hypothetical protein